MTTPPSSPEAHDGDAPVARFIEVALAEGMTTLGRATGNTIQVRSRTVSRRHVVLVRNALEVRVINRSATNPTTIAGEVIRDRWLSPGDRIRLGDHVEVVLLVRNDPPEPYVLVRERLPRSPHPAVAATPGPASPRESGRLVLALLTLAAWTWVWSELGQRIATWGAAPDPVVARAPVTVRALDTRPVAVAPRSLDRGARVVEGEGPGGSRGITRLVHEPVRTPARDTLPAIDRMRTVVPTARDAAQEAREERRAALEERRAAEEARRADEVAVRATRATAARREIERPPTVEPPARRQGPDGVTTPPRLDPAELAAALATARAELDAYADPSADPRPLATALVGIARATCPPAPAARLALLDHAARHRREGRARLDAAEAKLADLERFLAPLAAALRVTPNARLSTSLALKRTERELAERLREIRRAQLARIAAMEDAVVAAFREDAPGSLADQLEAMLADARRTKRFLDPDGLTRLLVAVRDHRLVAALPVVDQMLTFLSTSKAPTGTRDLARAARDALGSSPLPPVAPENRQ